MEITGTIKEIGKIKEFNNDFKVQDLILDISQYNQTTGEKYENFVKLQISKSKPMDFINNCKIGEVVKVNFNLSGKFLTNEETGKEFFIQNLNAWKIERK